MRTVKLQWEQEKLFLEADDFFSEIYRQIGRAQHRIDVEVYIFAYDKRGKKVLTALSAAARRGVNVRILVDAFGSSAAIDWLRKECAAARISLRIYHSYFNRELFRVFRTFNQRNHRKTWIFDRQVAAIGSANIIENDWKEIGVLVSGSELKLLETAFQKAWIPRKFWERRLQITRLLKNFVSRGSGLVRLNDSLPRRNRNYNAFLRKLKSAETRIWLANAYFAPQYRMIKQLGRAAQRNVDVRLLVPAKSDVFFMPWLTLTYYYGLLRAGVKIYEYSPRFLHAKTRIVDNWMIVGSSNLNHRSLLHDLEVDIKLSHADNHKKLEEDFHESFASATPVTLESFRKISWFKKAAAHLLLLVRYWL